MQSENVFVTKKVENTVSWANVVSNLKGEETVGTFYEKELQNKSKLTYKLNFKWKGYDNCFNSCID